MIGIYSGVGDSLKYHVNMRANRAAEVRVTILSSVQECLRPPLVEKVGPACSGENHLYDNDVRQTRGLRLL